MFNSNNSHSILVCTELLINASNPTIIANKLLTLALTQEYEINFIHKKSYESIHKIIPHKLVLHSNIFTFQGKCLFIRGEHYLEHLKFDVISKMRNFGHRKITYIGDDKDIIQQIEDLNSNYAFKKTDSSEILLQYIADL